MSSQSRRKTMHALSGSDSSAPDVPVLRARSIADLLASVPALLGFHPHRSLVAIAMHESRLGLRLRIDLPPPEHTDAAAAEVLSGLRAHRPDGVLLIAYVEPDDRGGRGLDRLAADGLIDTLRSALAADDLTVFDAVRCDGRRYWSYLCDSPDCCPADGTPYDVEASPLLARAVYNGVEVLPDRSMLERRFQPIAGAARVRMAAATDAVVDEILGAVDASDTDEPSVERRTLRRGADFMTRRVGELDASSALVRDDDDAARLSVWAMLVPVRDLAWSAIERDNAAHHLRLWTSVAQRAVSPFEPAALCLAAFCAWLLGDGAQARCALDRALRLDPDYSMGRLLVQLLDAYVSPKQWRAPDREAIRAALASKGVE